MNMHYKTFPFTIKSTSESEDENIGTISGYGSIFGNVDSYGERVAKGAFIKSLNSGTPIKMLWQHDSSMPIGNWKRLQEDQIGLEGDAVLPLNIVSVREKYEMAKAGLVGGLSIGYMIRPNGWEKLEDNTYLLKDLDLREISLVTFPANPLSLVSDVKNFNFKQIDLQNLLIHIGFSREKAIKAATAVFEDEKINQEEKEGQAILESINKLKQKLRI